MLSMDEGPLGFDPDTIAPGGFPVRFGRYELSGLLGDGATARVFRAHLLGPANFRKPVALKIVRAEHRARGTTQSLIFDEARIGGRLIHPNLVETYDVGERGGHLFVAMQLVDGLTARQLMREVEHLPARAVLELARQVADGLAHAHTLTVDGRPAQLVHRDLKLANVLIGRDGIARIADFGIARALGLTEAAPEGAIWGTLGYMAPEQAFGRTVTQASDVFSLGLVIAEMAMGKRFAPVKDMPAYVGALKELGAGLDAVRDVVDQSVPGLGPIVAKCLRLVPGERYPTGKALANEIAELPVPGGRGLASVMQHVLGEEEYAPVPSAPPAASSADLVPASHSESPSEALDESIATIVTDQGSASSSRGSEPAPVDRLYGRDQVQKRLVLRLSEGDRLVTLTGLGGVGKTALARAVAHAVAPHLQSGAWEVELAGVTSPEAFVAAVGGVFNVPMTPEETLAGTVARVGAAIAGRGPLLLLLDGFEPLVPAAQTTVGRWLEAAPEARFLVTSRERLRLEAWEFVERLGPLSAADARALFLARAAAVRPVGNLDAAALAELDAVVARLDGLPLAIELAAAHATLLTGDGSFTARLGSLLDAAPARDGRRGALRATLDWSWELLKPWERAALAQLTVFRGGFTLEAVQGVLDLSDHPDAPFPMYVLEALLECSLVHLLAETTVPGTTEPAEARFGLYGSVAAYAAERLAAEPAEQTGAEHRHGAWFARFGQPAWICALDTRGGLGRRRTLAREHENLAVAAERALDRFDAETAAALALALAEVAPLCGRHEGARLLAQQVLAMDAPKRQRAWLALRLGSLWRDVAQADMALAIATEVLHMAEDEQDEALAVRALELIAACEMEGAVPRPAEATAACTAGLARARAIPDRIAEALLLGRQGAIEAAVGSAAAAEEALRRAQAIHREVGNRRGEINDLCTLGRALLAQGRLAEAARTLKTGVLAAREIGDPEVEALNLHTLAELSLHLGRVQDARRLAEQAFQLHRHNGNARFACLTEGLLGEVHAAAGDTGTARALLEQAIETCDALGYGPGMGGLRAVLATVTAQGGDTSTARYLLRAAESFLREAGDRGGLARMLCRRGHIEADSVNLVGAWTALEEATTLAQALGAGPESPTGKAIERLSAELTEV